MNIEFDPNKHEKVDGGFVKNEAITEMVDAENRAKATNYLLRSFVDRLLGKN